MKFFTMQKLKAWKNAQLKGYLSGNGDYIDAKWFGNSYKWMMKQMALRLKNYNNELPIWLWLDTSNIYFNELLNDEWVLLEINILEEDVLLSNFNAWNVILNDGHLNEDNTAITKEQSWEYIFNKNKMKQLGYSFDIDDLQGVIGKVDCKNIKPIKYILNSEHILK